MSFFEELKQRKVFRTATAYAVVAFVIMQIVEIVFPMFEIPDWAGRMVIILLFIGFPVIIVFSWIFEVTEKGLVKSQPMDASDTRSTFGKKRSWFTVGGIILGLGFGYYIAGGFSGGGTVDKDNRASIAVLPFDNMSEGENDDYFSDGITEDIITYLSKIEGLKVISRTSIMKYKDSKMNIKDIAKDLGVTNILEGSVRRSGNKVRITGQLIDAETDEHLWAEIYDRTMNDIFTVQTEVAKSIAAALETEMTDKDVERLNKTMTTNPDAYELLQKIKPLKVFVDDDNYKRLELLEKAAMLDPESAYIHSRLCQIHTWLYFFGSDRTEKRLEKAKAALDKAMELDPLLAEVHQDIGFYHYVLADYEKALQEYALADRLEPNNVETLWRQSLVYRRQGKFEESYSAMEKCHDLDPKNYLYPTELIGMSTLLGKPDKFEHYHAISSELGMDFTSGLDNRVSEKFGREGSLIEYKIIVDDANKIDHGTRFHESIASYYVITGNYDMALKHLERRKSEDAIQQTYYASDLYWKAIVYKTKGDGEKSKQLFEDALEDVNDKLEGLPDDARVLFSKGKILAYLDRKEEAIKNGEKAISRKSVKTDKLQGGDYNYHLAKIYVLVGDYDPAIQELRKVYEVKPKNAWIGFLLHDAEMANIQDYKPFKDLLSEMRKVQGLD